MSAYLLLLLAIISRVMPHPDWLNFTAVGGSLLFFGARRSLRQMWIPLVALAATDYYLTAVFYRYPFHMSDYVVTWAWYAAVIVFAHLVLAKKATAARVAAGAIAAPTSFFLITNFEAWLGNPTLYPRSMAGLGMSYVAGLPFYRNDLISTVVVAGLAFGLPVLARQITASERRIAGV